MSGRVLEGSAPEEWLPALVLFSAHGGDWARYEDALYAHFRADFIDSEPTFPGRRWAMKRHPVHEGKEATFWHITSKGFTEEERIPDFRKCERIRWPRPIIDAMKEDRVKVWVQRSRSRSNERRIALATEDFGYIIVLADRTEYVLLWTAYPVERKHTRRKLRKEYERYQQERQGG